jgi:hypothetical protein
MFNDVLVEQTVFIFMRRLVQHIFLFFILIRLVGGGVQLGTIGTAVTDWPIVACPE